MFRKKVLSSFILLMSLTFISAYEKVPVTISFKKGGELYTSFYCFNDLEEGKKIAEEIFHIKKFDELSRGKREKVMPVPLGTNVGYYDWAVFGYKDEFWLFENRNGFLWGRGTLLAAPLD